jgi:hypothetical protein
MSRTLAYCHYRTHQAFLVGVNKPAGPRGRDLDRRSDTPRSSRHRARTGPARWALSAPGSPSPCSTGCWSYWNAWCRTRNYRARSPAPWVCARLGQRATAARCSAPPRATAICRVAAAMEGAARRERRRVGSRWGGALEGPRLAQFAAISDAFQWPLPQGSPGCHQSGTHSARGVGMAWSIDRPRSLPGSSMPRGKRGCRGFARAAQTIYGGVKPARGAAARAAVR